MRSRKLTRGVVLAVVVVALLVVAGPYVYIHFIEGKAPSRLRLSTNGTSPASGQVRRTSADGTWKVGPGSQVGYRVNEVLFGQKNEAVGRTGAITGTVEISGTTLRAASFTVDMTTVKSDQDRRDRQFQGRIMDTATYPTATFTASSPVDFGARPSTGSDKTVEVPGQLTLRGTTKPVTLKLTARYTGSTIDINGSLPITFADWNIPNPSFGGVVTTEDHGVLELLLHLVPA
jgi:polyisoprenoid-binding protein YceI